MLHIIIALIVHTLKKTKQLKDQTVIVLTKRVTHTHTHTILQGRTPRRIY